MWDINEAVSGKRYTVAFLTFEKTLMCVISNATVYLSPETATYKPDISGKEIGAFASPATR